MALSLIPTCAYGFARLRSFTAEWKSYERVSKPALETIGREGDVEEI